MRRAGFEVARFPEGGVILEPFARGIEHPSMLVAHQRQAPGQAAADPAIQPSAAGQPVQQTDQLHAGVEVGRSGIELEMPAAAVAMGSELATIEIGNADRQGAAEGLQPGGFAEQGFAAHRTYHWDAPSVKTASNLTLSRRISLGAESGPEPCSRIVPKYSGGRPDLDQENPSL
jgi:hypothetical protein